MVLQVLDLVNSNEQFYGDCPIATYTDLDVNTSGHTTCTVIPQGTSHTLIFEESSRVISRLFVLWTGVTLFS